MSLSNYMENNLLKVLKNEAPAKVEKYYVKLHTGDPGEEGTSNAATEATRKELVFGTIASGSVPITNTPKWTSVSTAETYSYGSVWDASTGGNCVGSGPLTESKAMSVGDNFELTSFTFSLD
jgi:hypothetical protein